MRRPRYAPLPTAAARQPNSESPGSAGLSWIGETGFEPATARPPAGCATRLRHSPYVSLQAGDGNRTRPRSLEGFGATTTLRPRGGTPPMILVRDPSIVDAASRGYEIRIRGIIEACRFLASTSRPC